MQFDLVFEGGGAKGMIFAGALEEFEKAGHTHHRLLGSSAGAITATLLAAGYDSAELMKATDERTDDDQPVFVKFMGDPGPFNDSMVENSALIDFLRNIDIPFIPQFIEKRIDNKLISVLLKMDRFRHLFSFVEVGGWFSADHFVTWMTEKLNTGTYTDPDGNKKPRNFGNMTLEQFFEATGKHLVVTASDTTGRQILILNHRTAPKCPVVWATRMSMSMPLVWQEVEWKASWGTYLEKDITDHVIVDGGMLSNFPIELLVSKNEGITKFMGEHETENVLGFLIDESMEVPGAVEPAESDKKGINWGNLKTIQRMQRLLNTMLSAHDKQVIDAFESLVVRLPAKGYGSTEFDMSDERKEALINAGRNVTKAYLDKLTDLDDLSFSPRGRTRSRGMGPEDLEATRAAKLADKVATKIFYQ